MWTARVVGTAVAERTASIFRHCGIGQQVILKREPKRGIDENAIGVYIPAPALFGLVTARRKIGYVPASTAAQIASIIDNGREFWAIVSHVDKNSFPPQVEIEISTAGIRSDMSTCT